MTATTSDVITAAMSIASDAADGKLSPTDLQATAVAECRELFGTVIGEHDPLWSLHADVARQAIALGALSADELSEWAAVMRHRTGEPFEPPAPPVDLLPPDSAGSVDESQPESTDDDGETDAAALQGASVVTALAALASAAQQAHANPAPQRPTSSGDGYDPLRGFDPGATRRL
ncbi:flagellar hook-length control protein [Gordonia amicalis]|uniref:Flagellar hook-length control protein n=1 Tax=Gordonia amicalis TaxID=89053 RepID=A0AAE4R7C2_9ACTN|nr:flagellar hook-length control protein [Gordonia amicalis]MDV6309695.1 flagellar hook-length control protein [Gordonia amicalis]MDV6314384.1 flagellar hook-length control protein [Gordonia amicalis]MDV7102266.1 flagellar hook-length control protein [Gordonia amicalis]